MTGDPTSEEASGSYNRRAFVSLLSALGVTGIAGCSGGDGDGTDTGTDDGADDGTDNGSTATPDSTPTQPPPEPNTVDPLTYDRPGDATVVFGEGVDGLSKIMSSAGGSTSIADSWELNSDDEGEYAITITGGNTGYTQPEHEDVHLHVEWKPPDYAGQASGQQSGNSGVFMSNLYEVQVLNNYQNDATYGAGFAGSLYEDAPAMVDPARPPTEWQAYDIIWRNPEFDEDENLVSPAACTVFFNGVCVLPHMNVRGPNFGGVSPYSYHEAAPVQLQDHGGQSTDQGSTSDIRWRNIWMQDIPSYSEDARSTFYSSYERKSEFQGNTSREDSYNYVLQDYNKRYTDPYREDAFDFGGQYGPPPVNPGSEPDKDGASPPGDANLSTPPTDATILLDGNTSDGFDGEWNAQEEWVTVEPGAGNLTTTDSFGDSQVHVEFRIPEGTENPDSGVLLHENFEVQIAGEGTGAEGTGAYTYQTAPLRDATKSAGEWQTLDLIWQAPEVADGQAVPGRVTALLNGQVVQHRLYIDGPNADGEVGNYLDVSGQGAAEPIALQENGSEVDFRFVWARELYPEELREGYQ